MRGKGRDLMSIEEVAGLSVFGLEQPALLYGVEWSSPSGWLWTAGRCSGGRVWRQVAGDGGVRRVGRGLKSTQAALA